MWSSVWRCSTDAELGRAGSVESGKTTCRTSEAWEVKLKKGVSFEVFLTGLGSCHYKSRDLQRQIIFQLMLLSVIKAWPYT